MRHPEKAKPATAGGSEPVSNDPSGKGIDTTNSDGKANAQAAQARAESCIRRAVACAKSCTRRAAAIHEAGHIVIAKHFGYRPLSAWIRYRSGKWTGRVTLNKRDVDAMSPETKLAFCVAGAVAEHVWFRYPIEDFWRGHEAQLSDSDYRSDVGHKAISFLDWNFADGRDEWLWNEPPDSFPPEHAAIVQVHRLLDPDGPVWQSLIAEARRLIVESQR
jgi:hypothetical protein